MIIIRLASARSGARAPERAPRIMRSAMIMMMMTRMVTIMMNRTLRSARSGACTPGSHTTIKKCRTLVNGKSEVYCPKCFRYLAITCDKALDMRKQQMPRLQKLHKKSRTSPRQPTQYAFATVLWGNTSSVMGYVMDALVLGRTLRHFHGDRFDRVLLVTEDLSANPLCQLLSLFWDVMVKKEINLFSSCFVGIETLV